MLVCADMLFIFDETIRQNIKLISVGPNRNQRKLTACLSACRTTARDNEACGACWWFVHAPVAVVLEAVVTGHSDESARTCAEGVEDLSGRVAPNLQADTPDTLLSHYRQVTSR